MTVWCEAVAGKPRRNLMDTQVTKASQRVETCPSSQNLLNPLQLVIFTQQTVPKQHGRTSRATATGLERRVVKYPPTSSRRIRFDVSVSRDQTHQRYIFIGALALDRR